MVDGWIGQNRGRFINKLAVLSLQYENSGRSSASCRNAFLAEHEPGCGDGQTEDGELSLCESNLQCVTAAFAGCLGRLKEFSMPSHTQRSNGNEEARAAAAGGTGVRELETLRDH
jgi:hypothetical protein